MARKKPFISEINRKKRLSFAELHKTKSFDFWRTVIFSGSHGRRMMWRKPNEALNIKNIRPIIKHDGRSVMVWGCMSALSVGKLMFIDGTMDKHVYLSILKEHLLYNTKHLPIPPQCPDINPIENLWVYFDRKVREHNISSKAPLKKYWRKNGTKYHPKNVGV